MENSILVTKIDKRDRAILFRDRLVRAMASVEMTQSALARATEVNRSTIAQLLDPDTARLPNAQLCADAAGALGVSTDWLLGLTDRPERPGDAIAAAVQMTEATRTPADDQLLDWYREAAGYKIRHVPASLPDMLKTEAFLAWEYAGFIGKTEDQAISAAQRLDSILRSRVSDHEIAMPAHQVQALADGTGYFAGLPRDVRREQLARIVEMTDELYPTLRVFLYDSRRLYSAPMALFGPLVGTLYVGKFYLAFRESTRLRSLTDHFDWLVREAEVDARDVSSHVAGILTQMG